MRSLFQVAATVEALQFDGSVESAQAIARAFPNFVALTANSDLMVVSFGRLVPVPEGWWVVEFVRFGLLDVMDPMSWRLLTISKP